MARSPLSKQLQPTTGRGLAPGDQQTAQADNEQIADLIARIAALESAMTNLVQSSHPTLMVPQSAIDLASGVITFAAAADYVRFANLTGNFITTSTSLQQALRYEGRGVLACCIAATVNPGGATTATGLSLKLTVDDRELVNGGLGIAAALRGVVVVGREIVEAVVNDRYLLDCSVGIPFNNYVAIELASNTAGQNVNTRWKLVKKRNANG